MKPLLGQEALQSAGREDLPMTGKIDVPRPAAGRSEQEAVSVRCCDPDAPAGAQQALQSTRDGARFTDMFKDVAHGDPVVGRMVADRLGRYPGETGRRPGQPAIIAPEGF